VFDCSDQQIDILIEDTEIAVLYKSVVTCLFMADDFDIWWMLISLILSNAVSVVLVFLLINTCFELGHYHTM